jgi:cobalt-precorrin-5B (C1)-methyltransferase
VSRPGPLREGFTTGTAAAGAAKAAALLLLGGQAPDTVDTPLPGGGRLVLPVAEAVLRGETALAVVVKDGGDDPDATHGARLGCRVTRVAGKPGQVTVEGGPGVGRVTLPGLPVAVGQPAINPAPLAQIQAAVAEAAAQAGYAGALAVVVEVEGGEAMARKTMNPRLGIVGGISILGVSGIVRPFSHQAFKASIAEALDVARALGHDTVGLASGRRSEALLARERPDLPETARVEAADFFAFSLNQAARRGFAHILWATFGGKLVKMAQGLANTHAHRGETDFAGLAERCRQAGWPEAAARAVAGANTARHAFELAPDPGAKAALAGVLVRQALAVMTRFAGPGPRLELLVFDFDGNLLSRLASAPPGSGVRGT